MSSTTISRRQASAGEERAAPAAAAADAASRGAARPVRAGVLAMAPLVLAYAPFAVVIGATAAEHGAAFPGWAGSWLIYGGSAQLAAIRTLHDAGIAAAILTGLVINARLLVYSAGLARTWRAQPQWFRFAAAGLINDPTFAFAQRHAAGCDDAAARRGYFLGGALTLGVGWSAAMAGGAFLGSRLDRVDLAIVVPLCLLALIGDGLRASSSRLVIGVAALVAVVFRSLPAGSGLLLAVLAGACAGVVADRRPSPEGVAS